MVLKCFWSVLKVRLRLDLLLLSSSGALYRKLMLITRVRCHSCHWHTKSHQKTPVLCFPSSSLYLYQITSENPRPMFSRLFSIPLPNHIRKPLSYVFQALLYTSTKTHQSTEISHPYFWDHFSLSSLTRAGQSVEQMFEGFTSLVFTLGPSQYSHLSGMWNKIY